MGEKIEKTISILFFYCNLGAENHSILVAEDFNPAHITISINTATFKHYMYRHNMTLIILSFGRD